MNICLVSHEYPPETALGGIGTQNWNKARTLARLGHTVHVITASGVRAPATRIQTHDAVTVHRIQSPAFEHPVYNPATFWLGYTWAVYRELRRLMDDTRLDVIDFAEYGAEGFAYQLDRVTDNWVPVVVQLHGPLALFTEQHGWPEAGSDFHEAGTFMEGLSIRHADALMACSANIADLTSRVYRVPRGDIEVIHCGVDADAFRPLNGEPRGAAKPAILFVGNWMVDKGLDATVEAVVRLHPKYPNLVLHVAGRADEDAEKRIKNQVKQCQADDYIEFLGFVGREAIPVCYQQAQVFCAPSHHEPGVANVYLEAMACGCPVVASTTGAAREAVIDGETGFLVPPHDPEATAAALDRILSDPALRARMGAAARRRVEDWFSMDKYIGRVLATYQKAVQRSGKATAKQLGSV